jgi:hypothetical protein
MYSYQTGIRHDYKDHWYEKTIIRPSYKHLIVKSISNDNSGTMYNVNTDNWGFNDVGKFTGGQYNDDSAMFNDCLFMLSGDHQGTAYLYTGWLGLRKMVFSSNAGKEVGNLENMTVYQDWCFLNIKDTLTILAVPCSAVDLSKKQTSWWDIFKPTVQATELVLNGVVSLGGNILRIFTLSKEKEGTIGDYFCVLTTIGELIVYQGTDPSNTANWKLVGKWRIPQPLNRRCIAEVEGDVIVATYNGFFSIQRVVFGQVNMLSEAMEKRMLNLFSSYQFSLTPFIDFMFINFYKKRRLMLFNLPVSVPIFGAQMKVGYAINPGDIWMLPTYNPAEFKEDYITQQDFEVTYLNFLLTFVGNYLLPNRINYSLKIIFNNDARNFIYFTAVTDARNPVSVELPYACVTTFDYGVNWYDEVNNTEKNMSFFLFNPKIDCDNIVSPVYDPDDHENNNNVRPHDSMPVGYLDWNQDLKFSYQEDHKTKVAYGYQLTTADGTKEITSIESSVTPIPGLQVPGGSYVPTDLPIGTILNAGSELYHTENFRLPIIDETSSGAATPYGTMFSNVDLLGYVSGGADPCLILNRPEYGDDSNADPLYFTEDIIGANKMPSITKIMIQQAMMMLIPNGLWHPRDSMQPPYWQQAWRMWGMDRGGVNGYPDELDNTLATRPHLYIKYGMKFTPTDLSTQAHNIYIKLSAQFDFQADTYAGDIGLMDCYRYFRYRPTDISRHINNPAIPQYSLSASLEICDEDGWNRNEVLDPLSANPNGIYVPLWALGHAYAFTTHVGDYPAMLGNTWPKNVEDFRDPRPSFTDWPNPRYYKSQLVNVESDWARFPKTKLWYAPVTSTALLELPTSYQFSSLTSGTSYDTWASSGHTRTLWNTNTQWNWDWPNKGGDESPIYTLPSTSTSTTLDIQYRNIKNIMAYHASNITLGVNPVTRTERTGTYGSISANPYIARTQIRCPYRSEQYVLNTQYGTWAKWTDINMVDAEEHDNEFYMAVPAPYSNQSVGNVLSVRECYICKFETEYRGDYDTTPITVLLRTGYTDLGTTNYKKIVKVKTFGTNSTFWGSGSVATPYSLEISPDFQNPPDMFAYPHRDLIDVVLYDIAQKLNIKHDIVRGDHFDPKLLNYLDKKKLMIETVSLGLSPTWIEQTITLIPCERVSVGAIMQVIGPNARLYGYTIYYKIGGI